MAEEENTTNFKSAVLKALRRHLALYPQSGLKDIYKSFFQDEFGPGHLLKNPLETVLYLERELELMQSRGRREVEPCGVGLQFCRVPMDLIKDGHIDKEDYVSAFLAGASKFKTPEIESWKDKWNEILDILKPWDGRIKDFEQDSIFIQESLQSGHFVMHHSHCYRSLYNPHYRIFSVDCIGSLMPPIG